MEAKDFELPIEGSLSKLALLHIQHEEEPSHQVEATAKNAKNPTKSLEKKKLLRSKKKK